MAIGQKIKYYRDLKKLTLDELSKHVGVCRQTLSRYETGVIGNIPSDKIERIAIALDTTPAKLMGWEEDDKKNLDTLKEERSAQMVEIFNTLDPQGMDTALALLQALVASQEKQFDSDK